MFGIPDDPGAIASKPSLFDAKWPDKIESLYESITYTYPAATFIIETRVADLTPLIRQAYAQYRYFAGAGSGFWNLLIVREVKLPSNPL